LRLVICDEWHELMGSKRGVQTELALARLRTWHPDLRIWGLSATIGNLDTAMETLLGNSTTPHRIVRGLVPKSVTIDALIPEEMECFPWAGHLGVNMLPQVIEAIEEGETTLVFTNTRSQAEIWYHAILEARPDWAGVLAIHHASLERKTRDFVEDALRNGGLRCVVCTSSLDLGVDFTPVDRVIQIGSPKGVARLLQRAGRSGHRPGAISRVTCAPTHAFELVEVAAARDAVQAGAIESRYPVERPLDLLSQWLVGMAIGGGFTREEMFAEVRSTYAFKDLSRVEWDWTIDFITNGGEALKAYPEFARVVEREGRFVIANQRVARRHLLSTGTIVSDAAIDVRYLTGARLGSVEEGFIARLRPGDHFAFSGKVLEFVRVRDMTAWVRKSKAAAGVIPSWQGGRMPLSSELSAAVRDRLDEAFHGRYEGPEMRAVQVVLETQAEISIIPGRDELLIERAHSTDGHHLFFFPLDGRLVHEGLGALLAWRMAQLEPITFAVACNDYGFEMMSPSRSHLEEALHAGILSPDNLAEDIPASLNAAEMAKRQFREIARVAGLTFTGYPGQSKSARQLQASSGLLFDVFVRYDSGNMLIDQAHREVLERQLERSRLGRTLERLSRARVVIRDVKRFSPLSFPLIIDRNRNRITSEKLTDRIKRMTAR
jgi:ATP-dependent Lhr-like helicase